MATVYALALVLGVVGLLVVVLGGAFADDLGHPGSSPGARAGMVGRMGTAALVGFGMGGLSAEFSPLDLAWPVVLVLALVGAVLAAAWARYASSPGRSR